MNIIEKIKMHFIEKEALKAMDSLKAKVAQYGPVVIATLSGAVAIASYFYGPIAIGGQKIPAADAKTALILALHAVTWLVHHFSKPSAAPASLPASPK